MLSVSPRNQQEELGKSTHGFMSEKARVSPLQNTVKCCFSQFVHFGDVKDFVFS